MVFLVSDWAWNIGVWWLSCSIFTQEKRNCSRCVKWLPRYEHGVHVQHAHVCRAGHVLCLLIRIMICTFCAVWGCLYCSGDGIRIKGALGQWEVFYFKVNCATSPVPRWLLLLSVIFCDKLGTCWYYYCYVETYVQNYYVF